MQKEAAAPPPGPSATSPRTGGAGFEAAVPTRGSSKAQLLLPTTGGAYAETATRNGAGTAELLNEGAVATQGAQPAPKPAADPVSPVKKGAGRNGNRIIAHSLVSGTVRLHIQSTQPLGVVSASTNMAPDKFALAPVDAAQFHSVRAPKAKLLTDIVEAVGKAQDHIGCSLKPNVHSNVKHFSLRSGASG